MRHLGLFDGNVMPLKIESHRAAPFNPRNTDVSVVLDLMIHDLDLVHQLNPSPIVDVQRRASARCYGRSDEVSAGSCFADGMQVELFASRMADARKRFMRITYPDGEIFIDFLTREMTNTTPRKTARAGQRRRRSTACRARRPIRSATASRSSCARCAKASPLPSRRAKRAARSRPLLRSSTPPRPHAPQKRLANA